MIEPLIALTGMITLRFQASRGRGAANKIYEGERLGMCEEDSV